MGQRFAGNVWFQKQVEKRTRTVLSSLHGTAFHAVTQAQKQEFALEYQKQEEIFRKERKAVKAKKAQLWQQRQANAKAHKQNQENPKITK